MRMSRQHFDFIADMVGPMVGWPSALHEIADQLEKTNPRFNRDKFLQRATDAWEKANAAAYDRPLDDHIRY